MIEIYESGKWTALRVIDKDPDLSALRVAHDPEDIAFHKMSAMHNQLISFKIHGAHYVGLFKMDANPVFEAGSIEFCRASITQDIV